MPALVKAGYRVIVPDTRGCGLSDMPKKTSAYHIDLIVSDLVGILDTLSIKNTILVGHDWGAAICWTAIWEHPDRFNRFAALSVGHLTAYGKAPIKQKIMAYYMLLFQFKWISEWLLQRGNWWLFKKIVGGNNEVNNWIEKLSRPGRLTACINYYRANKAMLIPRNHPNAEVPVMGIWGEGDIALCEEQMIATADYTNKGFEYHRVSNGGHWLQLDKPDEVSNLLISYFGKDLSE